jgi:hypothetical protein
MREERIDEAALVGLLQGELTQGDGWANSDLVELRANALGYYYGELPPPEAQGRSVAVSTDVADMVEAIVAQILPGFSGDNVVEFEPNDAEDVEQAQLESDIVNDVVLEQNRGYVFFQEALRDSLLLRNGWTRCFREEYDTVEQQYVDGVVPDEIQALAVATFEGQRDVVGAEFEYLEDSDKTVLKVTRKRYRMCVASVDPTTMVWEADWTSVFLDGIRFVAQRSYPTVSDLLKAGYSETKIELAVTQGSLSAWQSDTQARYDRSGGNASGTPYVQPANIPYAVQNVEVYTCYYTYDGDGDGIAELHEIVLAGGTQILSDRVVDFIPYATGTPFLQPHQLNGLGVFDKVRTIQDIKTAVIRKWINNLEAANNSRIAYNTRTVNGDDVKNSRPGGAIRVMGSPASEIVPVSVVDTGASSMALLGYADKMRSERGGAALDMQSAAAQVGSNASGVAVDREYSVKEQLAALACRTLAETLVRTTYAMVHRGLRTWFTEEISARVRGEFVRSNPGQWRERFRINVKSGLSVAERSLKKLALEQVLGQQQTMLTAGLGGQITDLTQVYKAQLDWTRAAALDNGERYFTNPQSPGAQQAKQAADAIAAADAQEARDIQKSISVAAQQAEAIKGAIDKFKVETQTAFDYFKAVMDAQVEAMKLGQASAAVMAMSAAGMEQSTELDDAAEGDSGGSDGPDAEGGARSSGMRVVK